MIVLLFSVWSCVAIVLWLTATKYNWVRPPWRAFILFAIAGICSCFPSLLVNQFLGRETQLWPFTDNPYYSFLGFTIGAGISEELWKMLAGVVAAVLIRAFAKRKLYPADVVAGFIIVGLGFAAFENIFAYGTSDPGLMFLRSMFAVPLHGGMGAIHGVAFNYAARKDAAWPMLIGWALAAAIHTWYDTWSIFFPDVHLMHIQLPTVIFVCLLVRIAWLRTPELPSPLLQTDRTGRTPLNPLS